MARSSERALGQAAALAAYTAASTRWPDEALVWQVLGNARYAAGDRSGAVAAYRRALDQQPLSESYNNLAHTLGELGCVREALAVLNQGLGGSDARWRPVLEQTRSELAQLEPRACVD
jgi:tetratricopeptide (TPR) repeat protein